LIRPPYSSGVASVLPEDCLEDAITRHGFSASAEEFASWEEVIAFLNQRVVAARRSLGMDTPGSIPGGAILEAAPTEVLEHFLDRVENELIPQGLFDGAEDLLLALLASTVRSKCPEIATRAAE